VLARKRRKKMPRKEHLFFIAIMLMGFLDWLTTVVGIVFFGATEVNPLLAGVTKSSMMLFSVVKLTAVVLAGFMFHKAAALGNQAASDWRFTSRLLDGGRSIAVFGLLAVVANNISVMFSL
jgi:hypothetical protein